MPSPSPEPPNPPARLVDRLYRRAARRKSTASSRRSSLGSSGHHHRPTHHHHVAQHLRRASILESRKARLADRAAHVEAVRTRAALIQAVPRATITSSEERAVAAALAREKKLREVAAACAEEVHKAKQRALETKARRRQMEIKTRRDIEERWAEADRRRQEHQRCLHERRLRRPSSPARKLPVVPEDEPILKIQRTWRLHRRRRALRDWRRTGFSLERCLKLPFVPLSAELSSTRLLDAVTGVLKVLGVDGNSRTFLTAYLVSSHPEEVFSSHGDVEADLTAKARELVDLFEVSVGRLAACRTRPDVAEAYMAYSATFEAWKTNDASTLIDIMVATFVEYDAIWTSVKDDTRGHVAEDFKMAIRDNQAMLLHKIRKLSPDADKIIKRAVVAARGKPKTLTADEEPRTRPTDFTPPARSSFFSSDLPSNRVLTHEVALNPNYRLTRLGKDRAAMIKLLCDSMYEGLSRGEQAAWTIDMAEFIRGRLLGLSSGAVREQIEAALDAGHVQAQVEAGVFSYDVFFSLMASVLPKICAPVRDGAVKDLADSLVEPSGTEGMMQKLHGLLECIELLALDHTNYMLATVGHVLVAEAPGYERRMFAKDLEEGMSLQGTKEWWTAARAELALQAAARDPHGVGLDRPTAQDIHNKALVDLVFNASETSWPETLRLDEEKLRGMQRAMVDMVRVGATLLTAKNLLKRDVRSAWKNEAGRMLGADADKAFSVLESAHNLPGPTRTVLQAACRRFYSPAGRTDPVFRLILQRLKTHVLSRLNATSSEERVRAISTAGDALAKAGLAEFVVAIGEFVGLLSRIKRMDWEAHSEWYLGF